MTLARRIAGRTPADVVLVARMLAWFVPMPLVKHLISLPRLTRIMWAEPRDLAATPEQQRRIVSRANLEPRLVLGVRRDGGRVDGHAWVTIGGEPVGESSSSVERFVPIAMFGRGGEPEPVAPATASANR
jgi:hypothetical protein